MTDSESDHELHPVTTAEARKHMAELVNRAAYGGERFVVTRHGKELAAIVPLAEAGLMARVARLLEERDFEAALSEIQQAGTVSWGDLKRDLDL